MNETISFTELADIQNEYAGRKKKVVDLLEKLVSDPDNKELEKELKLHEYKLRIHKLKMEIIGHQEYAKKYMQHATKKQF